MGSIGIHAVGLARNNDANRFVTAFLVTDGSELLHRVHLHRRGMRAQKFALALLVCIEEERVMHFARRMAFREVQRREIVIIGFDIRTFGDRETHIRKDRGDFIDNLRNRVNAAARCSAFTNRQSHVDLFALKARGNRLLAQLCFALSQCFGDAVLQTIDRRSLRLTLFWRHGTQRLQLLRDSTLFAKCCDAHRFNRLLIAGSDDFAKNSLFELFKIAHF
ncbi:hypothetical protein D9M72_495650 [compost metagenome]